MAEGRIAIELDWTPIVHLVPGQRAEGRFIIEPNLSLELELEPDRAPQAHLELDLVPDAGADG